jgi:hypothetical protein
MVEYTAHDKILKPQTKHVRQRCQRDLTAAMLRIEQK